MKDNIVAQNLSKRYGGKVILNNVDLIIDVNKINVLFGPSGSGKTTLCRNLALLDYPDEGKISLLGTDYIFPVKKKINNLPYPKVNFVFQQLFLWPHLTNRENILLAINDKTDEIDERLIYYSRFFNIEKILGNYPNESSVGEKQRVAITRALILNPEFVFFDEITSALDIVQINKIVELMFILKEKGIGVLLITHNMYVIEKIADTLIFMQDGKIIETGKKNILIKPETKNLANFLL